jgi:AraC family transcriptional regulator, positive regulator of tynA and feaB
MYETFSLALQKPQQRFDYFQGLIERLFCPMQIEPRSGTAQYFEGALETASLGAVRLARVATSACLVRRRAQDIARVSEVAYLVKFQTRGEALWRQRNREVHLRPGDFVVCSVAEPYRLEFRGPYAMPVLALSAQTMRALTADPDQFLGVRLSGEDADCGLLSAFVAQVSERMSRLSEAMIGRVEANILDLLGGVLAARTRHGALNPAQQSTQIKAYVDLHVRDRQLTPAFVATAFGISTRHLHSLFQQDAMTIGQYIRSLRARGCRAALESGATGHRSLTDLALSWGFYDLSHMTRCFKSEFGMTPSEVGARAATAPATSPQPLKVRKE